MKDFLLPTCFRRTPSNGSALDKHRPIRWWMTGSLAVVMAALTPPSDAADTDREHPMRVLRHSRFGVDETVLRIENSARQHGLSVLARMDGSHPVIVLESSVGGTLVVMNSGANASLDMPLSVMVRAGSGGGADVLIAAAPPGSRERWSELPQAVADDLAALPALVESALG
jgi:uncharacterized protein (DUF302 family)